MEKKQTCPNCREPEMEEDNGKLTCPECGLELHLPKPRKLQEQRIDAV